MWSSCAPAGFAQALRTSSNGTVARVLASTSTYERMGWIRNASSSFFAERAKKAEAKRRAMQETHAKQQKRDAAQAKMTGQFLSFLLPFTTSSTCHREASTYRSQRPRRDCALCTCPAEGRARAGAADTGASRTTSRAAGCWEKSITFTTLLRPRPRRTRYVTAGRP
jgi:hypothetical protein